MSKMKKRSNAFIQLEQVNLVGQQIVGKAPRKNQTLKNPENLITGWQILEKNVKNMYINLDNKVFDLYILNIDFLQAFCRLLNIRIENI